jgi:hypothetical protein
MLIAFDLLAQTPRWKTGTWFRVEHKPQSVGQKYVVRCTTEMAGSRVAEEREVKGDATARKTAEKPA